MGRENALVWHLCPQETILSIFCPASGFLSAVQVTLQDDQARARPSDQLGAFRGPHSQGATAVCKTQAGLLEFSGALQHPANAQLGLESLFSDSNLNISVSCSTSTQVFVASPRASPHLCGNLEQRFLVTLLAGICSWKTGMYIERFQSIDHCLVFMLTYSY